MRPRALVALLVVFVLLGTGVLTALSLRPVDGERATASIEDEPASPSAPSTPAREHVDPESVERSADRPDRTNSTDERAPPRVGPARLDIVVLLPGARPLPPGTRVTLRDDATGDLITTTTADANGRVRAAGLPETRVRLDVEDADGERHRAAVNLRARTRTPPGETIALDRGSATQVLIVDEHGAPLPDARLDLLNAKAEVVETLAPDARGSIPWDVVTEAVTTAAAEAETETSSMWIVARGPGRAREMLRKPQRRIVLRRGHDISGVVRDDAGLPVRGAVVSVGSGMFGFRVTTDERGEFRLHGLVPSGRLVVNARAEGYAPAFAFVSTARDDVLIELGSELATATIRGVVLRPDGSPAAGARVDLRTETDARGRFVLEGAPSGQGHVSAQFDWVETPGEFGPGDLAREWGVTAVDVPRGGVLTDVTIRLEVRPVSFALIRVVDESGAPVAGLLVTPPSGWGGITDAAGRAATTISNTAPGTTVKLTLGNGERTAEVVTRDSARGDPQQIVIPPRPRLRVRVIGLSEEPDLEVRASSLDGRNHIGVTLVDDTTRGERTYEFLPPSGVRTLVMTSGDDGYGSWVLEPVGSSTRTETLDVRLERKATLDLRGPDGTPARGVIAHATLRREAPLGRMSISRFLYHEPGKLIAYAVPAGDLDVLVYRHRTLAAIVPITMSAAHDPVFRVTVPEGRRVAGRIVGNDASPLGGCTIHLLVSGGHQLVEAQGPLGISDEEGRFEILVPDIDGAALAFVRDEYATQIVRLDGPASVRLRRVALRPAGRVRVHGGTVYSVGLPGTDLFWEPEYEQVRVNGVVTTGPLIGLPDEEIELGVYIGTERSTRTIRVPPGRTIDLDLRRP